MPARLTIIGRALVFLVSLAVAYPVTRWLGADSATWPFLPVALIVSVTVVDEIERRWQSGPGSDPADATRLTRSRVLNAVALLAVVALAMVLFNRSVLDALRALAALALTAIPVWVAVIVVLRWRRPGRREARA